MAQIKERGERDMSNTKINRVEVIDHTKEAIKKGVFGRVYTNYTCPNVEVQLQDDDKTLKIFISDKVPYVC